VEKLQAQCYTLKATHVRIHKIYDEIDQEESLYPITTLPPKTWEIVPLATDVGDVGHMMMLFRYATATGAQIWVFDPNDAADDPTYEEYIDRVQNHMEWHEKRQLFLRGAVNQNRGSTGYMANSGFCVMMCMWVATVVILSGGYSSTTWSRN
jgi:hypothetical protein